MVQNTAHHLSFQQVQFLNRGPTYIIPCQMHLFSMNHLTLEEILTQQVLPLRKQLLPIFSKYALNLARQQAFRCSIEREFFKWFSKPIPIAIQQRALYEKQLLQSIQLQLKQDHLILRRTADNYNTFYLTHQNDFNHLAQNHMETSNCFEIIDSDIVSNSAEQQQHLTRIIQSMDTILQQLVKRNLLRTEYFTKLQLEKKTNLNLPYLYFLPNTHQNGHVQLQPRLSSCKNAPVRTVTTFLDQLLRPLFENCSQATTFLDGHDFIQRLQQYSMQADCLTSNTKFVTFELHNLYMRISHEDLLMALNQFLVQQLITNRHQQLSIQTIIELTKFALEHHFFTYNGKIYRYIKGSPLNYAFTQLLFDIYLHYWQMVLVRHIRTNNQFYGRYHNRGIFTWNDSSSSSSGGNGLHTCITELNEQNPDIQLTISTGTQVHFLHAHIENRNGVLHTRVYQDPTVQPFLLPYAAEHPRLLHRQWFRFCLVRAIQYCPSFDDFQEHCLQIELTYLANGYSLDFVVYHLKKFFARFSSFEYKFARNRLNHSSIRQQVFRYYNQKKLELKRAQQQQQLTTIPRSISFYYLFDWGNRIEFNRMFHQLWSNIVKQDLTFASLDFKVLLRSKHCYSSNTLLVRYK